MTTSIYVVEKQNKHSEYRQLVGVYENKELADAGGEQSLEMNDPENWMIQITILPLNGKIGVK